MDDKRGLLLNSLVAPVQQLLMNVVGYSVGKRFILTRMFKLTVDLDGGGTISRDELSALVTKLGLHVSKVQLRSFIDQRFQSELASIIDEIDMHGTGEIDFKSFTIAMSKKVRWRSGLILRPAGLIYFHTRIRSQRFQIIRSQGEHEVDGRD